MTWVPVLSGDLCDDTHSNAPDVSLSINCGAEIHPGRSTAAQSRPAGRLLNRLCLWEAHHEKNRPTCGNATLGFVRIVLVSRGRHARLSHLALLRTLRGVAVISQCSRWTS